MQRRCSSRSSLIEATDLVFAVDSIPTIYAITETRSIHIQHFAILAGPLYFVLTLPSAALALSEAYARRHPRLCGKMMLSVIDLQVLARW
ncbi:MAG: hypothetical protein IPF51_12285 [Dehalococcoidia bacterium]|nr:hypothetical protein [Dehalococcoidia bacterium]